MPALPIVKHPINVYGPLYSEWDTEKPEGRNPELIKLQAAFIYPGTQTVECIFRCHFVVFFHKLFREKDIHPTS